MSKKVFFQDFLFEGISIDADDNPVVEIEIIDNLAMCPVVNPNQDFDYYNVALKFSDLVEMRAETDWQSMLRRVESCEMVVLIDDLQLENKELIPYKEFYMKSYYYVLKQHNTKCVVYREM